jgi:hypothetical protein
MFASCKGDRLSLIVLPVTLRVQRGWRGNRPRVGALAGRQSSRWYHRRGERIWMISMTASCRRRRQRWRERQWWVLLDRWFATHGRGHRRYHRLLVTGSHTKCAQFSLSQFPDVGIPCCRYLLAFRNECCCSGVKPYQKYRARRSGYSMCLL